MDKKRSFRLRSQASDLKTTWEIPTPMPTVMRLPQLFLWERV